MKYLLNRSIALLSVFAMMISFAAVSASAAGEEAVTGEAAYISADADVTAAAIQGEEPLVTEAAAHRIHGLHCLVHYLGTYAVSRQFRDSEFHMSVLILYFL